MAFPTPSVELSPASPFPRAAEGLTGGPALLLAPKLGELLPWKD